MTRSKIAGEISDDGISDALSKFELRGFATAAGFEPATVGLCEGTVVFATGERSISCFAAGEINDDGMFCGRPR
jgi:hypothetical protein